MKKILLIALVIQLPFALTGQNASIGISIGVNLANWLGDDVLFAEDLAYGMNLSMGSSDFKFTSTSRTGFSAGFLVDYKLAKFFSVQPEISYSQKGAKFAGTGTVEFEGDYYSVKEDLIMQLDYVDFILLAKFSLTKSNIRPYIIAGPGAGYLVYSKIKVKVTVDGDTETDSSDTDIFNKWDYHVNVGGGFDFSGSARIEFRYYYFFNPVYEETGEYKLYNSVKSINLTVNF
jgi:hypothetical protein